MIHNLAIRYIMTPICLEPKTVYVPTDPWY
jgi:hypothetical protein